LYSLATLSHDALMEGALLHPDDFHLAQECLEGKPSALELFRQRHHEPLVKYLTRIGGSFDQVSEIVGNLLTDCVAPASGGRPKLYKYNGMCSLMTWLTKLALNNLISLNRREREHAPLEEADRYVADRVRLGARAGSGPHETIMEDAPLLALMRNAIDSAFARCPPEDFVILQLVHIDGLSREDLAPMFHCDASTISRWLNGAAERIEAAVGAAIKTTDPWLDLRWQDFVDLCRTATPACFGLEGD
jgi:RNA polymerase sigma-70 factor